MTKENLLVVGAGHPIGGLGFEIPILRNEKGIYFHINADPWKHGYLEEAFDESVKEDLIVPLRESIPISKIIPDYVHTIRDGGTEIDAFLFFFSQNTKELLENHPAFSEGELCHTKYDEKGIEFRLLSLDRLFRNVLPQLSETAKKRINIEFRRICKEKGTLHFDNESEVGYQLVNLLSAMAYDTESAKQGIDYEGLTVLHYEPIAKNYKPWLSVALAGWDLQGSPEYWKKRSLDLLERIRSQ